ncbi:MAG: glycosyltransferase family 39 protein [Candidatus Eremiobacteraeota bacterium]|nr:glycosyltransferase family 39 protein [Candidatus Eremiobacteraeota bacterium]
MKLPRPIRFGLYGLWLAGIAVLLVLHAVHLRADFPNNSPWMDYSKYTDEGWYGKAAIEHYVLGSWYVHGDFNPSVALPVLPAIELVLFRFTGVSLVAARLLVLGILAVNLLLAYFVVRTQVSRPSALFAVTLLVANAFLYAFSRLAILEQPLMMFLLASWLLALYLPRMTGEAARSAAQIGIGLLLCLAVLTKTTALFLIPSTLFLIWHAYGYKFGAVLKPVVTVALAGFLPFGLYYGAFVWPRYAYDYHYLFAANVWDQPTSLWGYLAAFWYALHGALWIDPWLCGLGLVLLALSALFARSAWRNPLLIASLLACAGYVFFIGWHNNMQPRYYQVMAYPLVFVITLALAGLFGVPCVTGLERLVRPLALTAVAAAAFISAVNLCEILYWTRNPEYTWISAARRLTKYIDRHPYGNRLLLSVSGDNITLITHLPAICDDFGTWDLAKRIHNYQPGWYAAWNELDPGTLEDLHTQYRLERVASFHAFDDPDRDVLILYKLHPLPVARQHYDQAIEEAANAGK